MKTIHVLAMSAGVLMASQLVSLGSGWQLVPYVQLDPYPWDKPRPPIIVPEGCDTLLSSGCEVTSNAPDIVPPDMLQDITDEKTVPDEAYDVEFRGGLQWIQVDLGSAKEIHAICIWHYFQGTGLFNQRAYRDVVCRISNDPEFVDGVITVFNNDYDNSAGFGVGKDKEFAETPYGRPFAVDAVKGRYIRWYNSGYVHNSRGSGNSVYRGSHFTKIAIYGKQSRRTQQVDVENVTPRHKRTEIEN